MPGKKSIQQLESESKGFTLRGLENTRIESLSDGVFAISIGLLLLSTTAPTTFDELMEFTRSFIPFAMTISMLMFVWHQHYLFFIRFGLRDTKTVALNTVLLFLVLFFVYPLKFLFGLLVDLYSGILSGNQEQLRELFSTKIRVEDTSTLMSLYGFGAAAIFLLLALLNYTALKRKKLLELSKEEILHTRNTIRINIICGGIPMLSALIAVLQLGGKFTFAIAGFTYMLYAVLMPIASIRGSKQLQELKKDDSE